MKPNAVLVIEPTPLPDVKWGAWLIMQEPDGDRALPFDATQGRTSMQASIMDFDEFLESMEYQPCTIKLCLVADNYDFEGRAVLEHIQERWPGMRVHRAAKTASDSSAEPATHWVLTYAWRCLCDIATIDKIKTHSFTLRAIAQTVQ